MEFEVDELSLVFDQCVSSQAPNFAPSFSNVYLNFFADVDRVHNMRNSGIFVVSCVSGSGYPATIHLGSSPEYLFQLILCMLILVLSSFTVIWSRLYSPH